MASNTRSWRLACLAAGVVAGLGARNASAQDYQRFRPAPGVTNYLTVEGALVAPAGKVSPSLWLNYGNNPVVTVDSGSDATKFKLVESMTTLNLMATYGLFDRFEIGVDLPVHYTTGEGVEAENKDGAGLGDLRLLPKVRLLGERGKSGFGVAAAMPVGLPTGSDKRGMSSAAVSLNPKAIVEGRFAGKFRAAANLGYKWVNSNETIDPADQGAIVVKGTEVGNEVTYGAAAGVNLGRESMEILAEVFGAAPAEDVKGSDNTKPLEGDLAFRYYAQNGLATTAGLGTGLVASIGTPDLRIFAGLAWEPATIKDKDADGTDDTADKCPDQAEDKDGFEDTDGCLDADNDKDTFLDVSDKCPNEAETKNGFQDEDGCPDKEGDRDGDGLLDSADKCPADAEDKDAFEDTDGCPDPDNDKDGILDATDKCPLEPEVVNGLDDTDGCADQVVTQVQVTSTKLEILDKVYFDHDKATIKPVSFDILNQVAAVLKAHPELKGIRIEGHTDTKGSAAHNLDLSQRRAESVKRYLVGKGIASPRLVPKGFGATKPLEAGDSDAVNEKNRRVEFVLLDAPAQP
jgi:outer membrane protein OmpA-like peptidoglycan-associated protein